MQAVFKLCEHKKRKKKRRKRKEITTSLDSNPLLMVDLLQITSDGPVHSRHGLWWLQLRGFDKLRGLEKNSLKQSDTQSDITRRHLSPYSYNISAEGLTMS